MESLPVTCDSTTVAFKPTVTITHRPNTHTYPSRAIVDSRRTRSLNHDPEINLQFLFDLPRRKTEAGDLQDPEPLY